MPTQITSAGITFNDTTSLTSANQICKAWVNFNGTTSPGTIRSSYNVSSVTKNGTGNYTVNFATPMADANYSWSGSADATGNTINGVFIGFGPTNTYPIVKTTSSLRVVVQENSANALDGSQISVQVFGN